MNKIVLSTQKGNKGQKKFKVGKGNKKHEQDIDITINSQRDDEVFVVQKLDLDSLDQYFGEEPIAWFNNFVIKKDTEEGDPINQSYFVTIPGLSEWRKPGRKIIIQDGNANQGKPYEFRGPVTNDTIELTDGDPAVGGAPPMG